MRSPIKIIKSGAISEDGGQWLSRCDPGVRSHRDRLRVTDRSTEDGGDRCNPRMRDGSMKGTSVACMRQREMVLQVFFGCSSGVLQMFFRSVFSGNALKVK
nr:hypothetical protein CFP56_74251 [Quercus suber]